MNYTHSTNIEKSLDVTEQLMLGYYSEYGLCWNRSKRKELLITAKHYHVFDGDNFLGFFAYFVNDDHIYVCDLQLLPEFQNKGIGTSVMQFILNSALSENLNSVELSVFKSNFSAISFYIKHGFVQVEESDMVFRYKIDIT